MSEVGYAQLQDVLLDEDFPDLDLALRRGRHVDREDASWYTLCLEAQAHLEAFYRRYGCELIYKADGYFYLLPTGDKLSRRQLAPGDMLVGQALALLYLDPAAIERHGVVSHEELIAQLSTVLGSDALIAAFNPKRKRHDERVAHKTVRTKVAEAVRRLASLGFVELSAEERLRLRPALLRFAEPVRGLSEPAEALAQLAARGELTLEPQALEDEELAADGGDDDLEGGGEGQAADGGGDVRAPARADGNAASGVADWDARSTELQGTGGASLDDSAADWDAGSELQGTGGAALDDSAADWDARSELQGSGGAALDDSAVDWDAGSELQGSGGAALDDSAVDWDAGSELQAPAGAALDDSDEDAGLFAISRRLDVPSDVDDEDSESEVPG